MSAQRLALDELGRVLAEPARLRILQELLGGTPLPAGALAARVGVAPSTVSGHLARLEDAGLIRVERHGRARLASLADPGVATAVEALLQLTDEPEVRSLARANRRTALREARSCYDHLAGRVGVAVAGIALDRGWITDRGGAWSLSPAEAGTDAVEVISRDTGLRLDWQHTSRPAVRACSDWTERTSHIAGRLGHCLLTAMIDDGWLRRRPDDRALTITPHGRQRLTALGVDGL